MKKTLFSLMAALLPLAVNAQLVSFQEGTGLTETSKTTKQQNDTTAVAGTSLQSAMQPTAPMASSRKLQVSIQTDIVSQYIWRGQELGGFSVQPGIELNWRNFTLMACGSTGLQKDDYKDIDVTLGYHYGPFNIGVTDYWCVGLDEEDRYFYYDRKKGAHYLDGNIGYTCKYFSLQGYCTFWGNDYKISDGSQAYSTYLELTVPFRLAGFDFLTTVGATPMESGGWWETAVRQTVLGERDVNIKTYQYADAAAVCLASLRCTKALQFNSIKVPVFAEFSTNPYLKKANFIFGISINP